MYDTYKNDFTKGMSQLYSVQSEFVKQATEANKKVAVEVLKTTKVAVDSFSQSIDEQIKKLNGV